MLRLTFFVKPLIVIKFFLYKNRNIRENESGSSAVIFKDRKYVSLFDPDKKLEAMYEVYDVPFHFVTLLPCLQK